MQILEELYLGSVRPSERNGKRNAQYIRALDEAIKADDAFRPTLTEEQRKIFENLLGAQRELNILTDAETFIYSFRLGAKIMMDILTESQLREI